MLYWLSKLVKVAQSDGRFPVVIQLAFPVAATLHRHRMIQTLVCGW